jgi:hypothetical protein
MTRTFCIYLFYCLERLIDGSFEKVEEEAGVVPFNVGQEPFKKSFVLVDGIYPLFSRFVRGIKEPLTAEEKAFKKWQEAVRKDIERGYAGVLKQKFQFLDRPILLMDLNDIASRVSTCLVLHGILVADRIMDGDCRAR